MHNLEELIAAWRTSMTAAKGVSPEALDELENHLREHVDQLVRSGMREPEAFRHAVEQLGGARMIASEFHKLDQGTWFPVKLIAGIGLTLAVGMLAFLFVQLDASRMNLLLAGHVFLVTLGYAATLLVGGLGVCFVGQRCFSDFSPSRIRSVTKVTFVLGCIAIGLTAAGLLLGMIWARMEWGRYWMWNAKEIGAFGVIAWQAFFLFVHRFASATAPGILSMSLLGNVVVSLGWFGANLLSGPRGEWTNSSVLLLVGVVSNLMFFLLGMAPAGWLRLRKTSE
jgi:hypothetical protein